MRDPRTIEVLELRVGYVKDRFSKLNRLDVKTDHCANGFRTTFSTLSHHDETKDAKAWDGDVGELQLADLDNSTVEGLYKRHGPLALIGSRTKLMQHRG